ncbi:hypothetical protein AVEN_166040-1 [Araneus ventricosus]|uniref:Uncharacterized protein n=1 Tax=Araneus ventricosus TaxID=182803 RepID=A0A4Y2SUE3_ARAVE|nr:hypothetical protein AVEN_166040-1 [Araneus ventricosus]
MRDGRSPTSTERNDKFEFFFNRLEKLLNSNVSGRKNTPRQKPERHLLEGTTEGARAEGVPGDAPNQVTHGSLAGMSCSSLNKSPEEG